MVINICNWCKTEYKSKRRSKQFCSKKCFSEWMSKERIGEKNPHFNNVWRQYHRIMKDIKSCKNCGRKYNLETHHLDGNRHNQDPNNLIKVCRRCHMLLDGRFANLNYHNSGTGLCAKGR
jgi:hypothetical protein